MEANSPDRKDCMYKEDRNKAILLKKDCKDARDLESLISSGVCMPVSDDAKKDKGKSMLLAAIYSFSVEDTKSAIDEISISDVYGEENDSFKALCRLARKTDTIGMIADEYLSTEHNRPSAVEKCEKIQIAGELMDSLMQNYIVNHYVFFQSNLSLLGCADAVTDAMRQVRLRTDTIVDRLIALLDAYRGEVSFDEVLASTSKYIKERQVHIVLSYHLDLIEASVKRRNTENDCRSGKNSDSTSIQRVRKLVFPGNLFSRPSDLYRRCKESEYYEGMLRCKAVYKKS